MRPSTFAVLSFLLLSPSLTIAAPHKASSAPYAHGHDRGAAHRSHNYVPRPWRKLTDAIGRIWGLPEKQSSLAIDRDKAKGTNELPAPKLLARYGEDVVLRFTITSTEDAAALAEAADVLFLDVWEFNEDWVDIRISKDVIPSLLGLLPPSLQDSHVALMHDLDLAQAILNSYPSPSATQLHDEDRSYSPSLRPSSPSGHGHPFFRDYQPLSVIDPWMKLMASMFTTHVRRINVGISYEGRDIAALRVGLHPTNDDQPTSRRKTVLVTGGSHAREWISTSTVNYLAWSLINSYGKVDAVTKLLESFDFVFVPTLNPDGYVYSWETDRLWRKNRQPTSLRFCRGVDLDRSYPFKWEGESTRSNPCSESYSGEAPFDGVEAQRFADWAKNETENNNVEFVGFLDLHSYSQQILYPYAYSCEDEPPTLEDLEELALGLAKAIRISRKGRPYKVTAACKGNVAMSKTSSDKGDRVILPRMESSGGSALDWFYHELRVKYAFQIKLRDTGSYGFLLPRENIVPTGEEILDSLLYFGRFMTRQVGFAVDEQSKLEKLEMETENSGAGKRLEEVEESGAAQMELRRRR